jgi:hypothetical protein
VLPDGPWGKRFEKVLDTIRSKSDQRPVKAGSKMRIESRGLAVLKRLE